jgi:hypothetical protein
MKPAKPIFDPAFRYLPSYATDIRKTFKRVSRQVAQRTTSSPARETVVPLKKRV